MILKKLISRIGNYLMNENESILFARVISSILIPWLCIGAILSIGEEAKSTIYTFEGMVFGSIIMVSFWIFGYFSRKPDPNRKGFKKWWKITKLIYRIFILERKCSKYPDLKKYRGNIEVKKIVKFWRAKLKELKSELNELVK